MSDKERDKDKAGLHKKISSIFSGVLIPQKNRGRMSSGLSTPEDTESAEDQQLVPEAQESESQDAQILPKAEPAQESCSEPGRESQDEQTDTPRFVTSQESKVIPIVESELESSEDFEVEPTRETSAEPLQESRAEQTDTPKFVTTQESKVIPIQESEVDLAQESEDESVQEPKAEQVHAPKFVTAQESTVIPIEESEIESPEDSEAEPIQETNSEPLQESRAEQADTSKLMTAHGSNVIPIEESEIESPEDSEAEPIQETNSEPVLESRAEQADTPKFVTAQESNVVPVQESEVESAQESENESVPQNETQTTEKPKVIAVQRFQKADIEDIAQKVTKKSSVVKVSSESSWKQIISKLCETKSGTSSTKQKAMVVMMPVLFIILIVFVIRGGVFGTSGHNAQTGDEINNIGVASAGLNDQIDWEIPEPYPATLRDPMQLGPVVPRTNQAENKEIGQLIVKSILYSEDYSSAIISNRIVHEGDQIQGASIIKINKDSVEFEMNGKKWSEGIQR
jgi:hypothetical protein